MTGEHILLAVEKFDDVMNPPVTTVDKDDQMSAKPAEASREPAPADDDSAAASAEAAEVN